MSPISRRTLCVTFLSVGAVVGVPCAFTACLSPTLPPLPPPSVPDMTALSDSEVLLEGAIPRTDAHILALNTATGEIHGQVVTDGTYSFSVFARRGDLLELWYRSGRDTSDITEVEVKVSLSGPSGDSSAADGGAAGDGDAGAAAAEGDAEAP